MTQLTRRSLLGVAGGVGLAALAGCSSGSSGTTGSQGSGEAKKITWWDHFNPLRTLNEATFAKYTKASGVSVQHQVYQSTQMGQALQLAKQSHQLPDVHSNAGLDLSVPALIEQGWLGPLQLSDEDLKRLPKNALIDGITKFDGKVYSFPIFNFRQVATVNYFNTDLVKQAGLDPANPPTTYDDFRAAATQVKNKTGKYGVILNIGAKDKIQTQVDQLAQGAGFEGGGGRLYKTGEINYVHDAYIGALEFIVSLQKDKLLFPGSINFSDKVARARWATGTVAYYFDGPWCPGVVAKDLKQFVDKMDAGPMLVTEKGTPVTVYRGPSGGAFYLSKDSKHPDWASAAMGYLTHPDYSTGLANNMDQPPLNVDVVQDSDALPVYKKIIKRYQDECFLAPTPVVKNTEVAKVNMESTPVKPAMSDIVGGLISGDVTDIKKALKGLTDRSQASFEKAMTKAKKKGAKVDESAWQFPNWKPRTDYTSSMYSA